MGKNCGEVYNSVQKIDMKIAVIAPLEESTPPQKYGGIEWIVYYVAQLLGEMGHQVDLFATGDSEKSRYYNLVPIVPVGLRSLSPYNHNQKMKDSAKLMGSIDAVEKIQKNKYDIIHNHTGWRLLMYANLIQAPIVTTHHNPLNFDYQNLVLHKYKDLSHVSISLNQRRDFPSLNYAANIYNGTDSGRFSYFQNKDISQHSEMLFLARMSSNKGAVDAAKVALKLHKKLNVCAKVDDIDLDYYSQFKLLIDGNYVSMQNEIGPVERLEKLQNARCLIAPIQWEEPFGLMFTEAMSCGTPVISYARGAAPEIIKDGETGYLINQSEELSRGEFAIKTYGIEGLTEAVEKIYSLSDEDYIKMRMASRKQVEDNFTVEIMAKQYEKLFKSLM